VAAAIPSSEAHQIFVWGQLRPWELAVGMLGEGEGVVDSILNCTEEREMAEGQLIGHASAQGDDGVEKLVSKWGREKRDPGALWRRRHARGGFYTTDKGEIRHQSSG
jgi:hypothetical protein